MCRYLSFICVFSFLFFFFFNDTATTEIYTLSLHDALPISRRPGPPRGRQTSAGEEASCRAPQRSEEHTSELQSPCNLVCRLLLEKKNTRDFSSVGIPATSSIRRNSCVTMNFTVSSSCARRS